jgi:hypothetical protein
MSLEGGAEETLARAVQRADAAVLDAPVLESVLARREAGEPRLADEGHARALAAELCAFMDEDGSWGGDLVRTAEALLLAHALTPEPESAVRSAVDAGGAWIRARQGQPGAFAEGCTPERHALRFCEHFITGFFSPAPPETDLSTLTLSSGVRFGGDAAARLGASCLGLRALLRWGFDGPDVDSHVDGVRVIVTGVALNAPSFISVAGYISAVSALIEAEPDARNKAAVAAGLERIAGLQRADGSWRGVDAFHVLDALIAAARKEHRTKSADGAIARAARMLALLQRADGTWGRETGPERTLTGWRALRYAAADPER